MNTDSPAARAHTRTGWRKSSYSTATGACVEIATDADGVALRHSKHPDAGTILFSYPAWTSFVRDASATGSMRAPTGGSAGGAASAPTGTSTSTNGIAAIVRAGTDTLVRSLATDVELRFDESEWTAFLAGVADGEFTLTPHLTPA